LLVANVAGCGRQVQPFYLDNRLSPMTLLNEFFSNQAVENILGISFLEGFVVFHFTFFVRLDNFGWFAFFDRLIDLVDLIFDV
jgi:hypothetical protein